MTEYAESKRAELYEFLPKEFKTVLDVGCGKGNFCVGIKQKYPGVSVWGIEPVNDYAQIAKNRCDCLFEARIEDCIDKLPKRYFDLISFNDVLEHLYDPKAVLENVAKSNILTHSGVVIASIPNVRYISNLYNLLIKKDWCYTKTGILDYTHIRFFTEKSMKRLFIDAGYKVDAINGLNKSERLVPLLILNILTLGTFADCKYYQFALTCRPANY